MFHPHTLPRSLLSYFKNNTRPFDSQPWQNHFSGGNFDSQCCPKGLGYSQCNHITPASDGIMVNPHTDICKHWASIRLKCQSSLQGIQVTLQRNLISAAWISKVLVQSLTRSQWTFWWWGRVISLIDLPSVWGLLLPSRPLFLAVFSLCVFFSWSCRQRDIWYLLAY